MVRTVSSEIFGGVVANLTYPTSVIDDGISCKDVFNAVIFRRSDIVLHERLSDRESTITLLVHCLPVVRTPREERLSLPVQ